MMAIEFYFFNGHGEGNSIDVAKNRLINLNTALKTNIDIIRYSFFKNSKDKDIHSLTDLNYWIDNRKENDKIIVVLLHFSAIRKKLSKCIDELDENLKNRLFILLFTGGTEYGDMKKEAEYLNNQVAGAYAIERQFKEFVSQEAWINLHKNLYRLMDQSEIGKIKSIFDKAIPAINGTDSVSTSEKPAEYQSRPRSEVSGKASKEIQIEPLGMALEILLEAAPLANSKKGFQEKLSDPEWWKKGLSGLCSGPLREGLEKYVNDHRLGVEWGPIENFLNGVCEGNREKLRSLAENAYNELKRKNDCHD